MHEFEKYYTEDLEAISLQGVTFHVKLPGKANKRFQRTVIAETVNVDKGGEMIAREVSMSEMADIQIKAFVKTSIRKVDGWDYYTPYMLLAMPDSCEDLWSESIRINNEREEEADAAAKKSVNSSDGKTSGEEDLSSTPTLKKQAG